MSSKKIAPFKLEQYFAKYEFVSKHLLCCSGKLWVGSVLAMNGVIAFIAWHEKINFV